MTAMSRGVALFLLMLTAAVPSATAQQSAAGADSAEIDKTSAELRSALRAFYFSLAHRDWEALSAGILPAKVVAHHPAPEAIVAASTRPVGGARPIGSAAANESPVCSSAARPSVDGAVITLRDDWAEVSVMSCGGAPGAADEFRFIHFEGRWWIVFIDLFRNPAGIGPAVVDVAP